MFDRALYEGIVWRNPPEVPLTCHLLHLVSALAVVQLNMLHLTFSLPASCLRRNASVQGWSRRSWTGDERYAHGKSLKGFRVRLVSLGLS